MTAESEAPAPHLLKILGSTFGVAVAVGNCVGAGILRAPAIIAHEVPWAVLIVGLWVLGGVQALLGANIMAELATALPKSGGLYIYAQRGLGDVGGLIVGWISWGVKVALYAANIAGLREGRALQEITSLVKAGMLFIFIVTAVVWVAPAEPSTMFSS